MRLATVCLAGVLALLLCMPSVQAQGETARATRPFMGLVRRDLAKDAAHVAALLAVVEAASRKLAATPDMQFIARQYQETPLRVPPLEGLALQLFTTRIVAEGAQGVPPNLEAVVELAFAQVPELRERLTSALEQPEISVLYSLVVQRLRSHLQTYDEKAPAALAIMASEFAAQERFLAVQRAVRGMRGTLLYLELLPRLGTTWENPEATGVALQKAATLDPANPLILVAQAELALQAGKSSEAQRLAADALAVLPKFARAHDVKGAALLAQRLPALAVAAFGQAIANAPYYAPYFMHRASANLVQEEIEAMCADLHAACALRDCEGLEWARTIGKCLP